MKHIIKTTLRRLIVLPIMFIGCVAIYPITWLILPNTEDANDIFLSGIGLAWYGVDADYW